MIRISGETAEMPPTTRSKPCFITTDKGVVEIVVLPGAMDAEQLTIMYTKWNGDQHHFYITGPWVRRAEDVYGQFSYFTLYKNWFIQTLDPELEESSSAFLDNPGDKIAHA